MYERSGSSTEANEEEKHAAKLEVSAWFSAKRDQLNIHILGGLNLPVMDSNGYSDPFVKIHLVPDARGKAKDQTGVKKKTINPQWNETFNFPIKEKSVIHTIELTVWDRNRSHSNNFMGSCDIDIASLSNTRCKPLFYKLEDTPQTYRELLISKIKSEPTSWSPPRKTGQVLVHLPQTVSQSIMSSVANSISSSRGSRGFHLRFLVLTDKFLYLFKRGKGDDLFGHPKGQMPLSHTELKSSDKGPLYFRVECSRVMKMDSKSVVMTCQFMERQEAEAWKLAILDALKANAVARNNNHNFNAAGGGGGRNGDLKSPTEHDDEDDELEDVGMMDGSGGGLASDPQSDPTHMMRSHMLERRASQPLGTPLLNHNAGSNLGPNLSMVFLLNHANKNNNNSEAPYNTGYLLGRNVKWNQPLSITLPTSALPSSSLLASALVVEMSDGAVFAAANSSVSVSGGGGGREEEEKEKLSGQLVLTWNNATSHHNSSSSSGVVVDDDSDSDMDNHDMGHQRTESSSQIRNANASIPIASPPLPLPLGSNPGTAGGVPPINPPLPSSSTSKHNRSSSNDHHGRLHFHNPFHHLRRHHHHKHTNDQSVTSQILKASAVLIPQIYVTWRLSRVEIDGNNSNENSPSGRKEERSGVVPPSTTTTTSRTTTTTTTTIITTKPAPSLFSQMSCFALPVLILFLLYNSSSSSTPTSTTTMIVGTLALLLALKHALSSSFSPPPPPTLPPPRPSPSSHAPFSSPPSPVSMYRNNTHKQLTLIFKLTNDTDGEGEGEGEGVGLGGEGMDRMKKSLPLDSISRVRAMLLRMHGEDGWGSWGAADYNSLRVRGPGYLTDREKIPDPLPGMALINLEVFHPPNPSEGDISQLIRNMGTLDKGYLRALRRAGILDFVLIVNYLVPGNPPFNIAGYFLLPDPNGVTGITTTGSSPAFDRLIKDFVEGSEDFRTSRFKLIPRVDQGGYLVKKSVGTTPAIIGKRLKMEYYQSNNPTFHPYNNSNNDDNMYAPSSTTSSGTTTAPATAIATTTTTTTAADNQGGGEGGGEVDLNYLEIVIDVSSSTVGGRILGVVKGYAKNLVIDLSYVLEGQSDEELPEKMLGGIRFQNIDLYNLKPYPYSDYQW